MVTPMRTLACRVVISATVSTFVTARMFIRPFVSGGVDVLACGAINPAVIRINRTQVRFPVFDAGHGRTASAPALSHSAASPR